MEWAPILVLIVVTSGELNWPRLMLCENISLGQIIAERGLVPVGETNKQWDFGIPGILRFFVTWGSVNRRTVLELRSFRIDAVLVTFF